MQHWNIGLQLGVHWDCVVDSVVVVVLVVVAGGHFAGNKQTKQNGPPRGSANQNFANS